MDIEPKTLAAKDRYGLLISSILPRPIAWVSSVNPQGIANLAPFSFFTGITAEPMSLCFAPVNNRSGVEKDTLINVRATGEFVVNLATEENAEKMNLTSESYPYGVNEFEEVGLTPVPSVKVKPPRVKESPIQMECRVLEIVNLSTGPLGGHLVLGEVVFFHAEDAIWSGGMRHQDIKAIGRMEGAWYARTRDGFELHRPRGSRR